MCYSLSYIILCLSQPVHALFSATIKVLHYSVLQTINTCIIQCYSPSNTILFCAAVQQCMHYSVLQSIKTYIILCRSS